MSLMKKDLQQNVNITGENTTEVTLNIEIDTSSQN